MSAITQATPTTSIRPVGRGGEGTDAFRKLANAVRPYIFLFPFLGSFVMFTVVPIAYAIYLSLFRTQLIGGTKFVGLSNFVQVFHDGQFWSGLVRMLLLGAVQVPVMLGLGLFFAVVFDLYLVRRWGAVYRLIYFIPYAIPGVISAFMWGYLYDPSLSPFDVIFGRLGLGQPDVVSSALVLPAIGNLVTWEWVGYNMLILYVTLRALPPELTDAAIVDGARLWDLVRYVKLPLIRLGIFLTAVLSIIGTFQTFTEPQILGAFSAAIDSYYTPNMLIYNTAFSSQDIAYAAALSLVLGAITIVATIGFVVIGNLRRRTRI